jgi:3-oxoadipate enol-lactonase
MPLARIGDIKLNYTVQGSGEWLVLIGGYASSNWHSWGAMITELAKTYRVLAFDNRGIGESDVPDYPYSTRNWPWMSWGSWTTSKSRGPIFSASRSGER